MFKYCTRKVRSFHRAFRENADAESRARIRAARFGHIDVDGQLPPAWEAEVEETFQEQKKQAERMSKARQPRRMLKGAFFIALFSFMAGAIVGQKVDSNFMRQLALLSTEDRVASEVRYITTVRAFREAVEAHVPTAQQEAIFADVKAARRTPTVKGSQRGRIAVLFRGPDPAIWRAILDDIKELRPVPKPAR